MRLIDERRDTVPAEAVTGLARFARDALPRRHELAYDRLPPARRGT